MYITMCCAGLYTHDGFQVRVHEFSNERDVLMPLLKLLKRGFHTPQQETKEI